MLKLFATNLFLHELLHLLGALIVSIIIFMEFNRLDLLIIVFITSFFIDLDHLTERFILHGFSKKTFSLKGNQFQDSGKMTLIFHSWELLPIILLLGIKFSFYPISLAIVLSAIFHYLVDNLVYSTLYKLPIFEYSILFRAFNRFSYEKLSGRSK